MERYRKKILYSALLLAIALFLFDRSTAYLYLPPQDAKEVIVYTTAQCPYCKRLRSFLDANQIPYVDRDIYKSPEGLMGFWALRGRGVPVSVVGPDVIHGFNIKEIRRSLEKLGYSIKSSS